MFVNILHRPGPGRQAEMFWLQQETAHSLKLPTTVMMPLFALADKELSARVRRECEEYGDEAGLYFGDMDYSQIPGVGSSQEPFLWLHTKEAKKAIIEEGLRRYRAVFGRNPRVTGSFHMDAYSLAYIKEKCPDIKITVGGCFEEGVKVFHGCNNSWYLFNEGMPWGPWYPAKENTLRPADAVSDWSGVVAVPHLSRDMVLSYEGRNDFFASHPGNIQRAMANQGEEMPYAYNMIDMYRYQERFNDGFSYLNVFVSPGWLRGNPYVQDSDEVTQKIYKDYLAHLAKLREEKQAVIMGMEEFADWYTCNIPVGTPQIYDAKEILYGSGKEYLWYSSSNLRLTFDLCQGGSIGDLRPLVSKQPRCSGADEREGAYATNPYLIQSQYRSGNSHHYMGGARSTLLAEYNGEILDFGDFPVRLERAERTGETVKFILTPACLKYSDGMEAEIVTEYEIEKCGTVHIRRRLIKAGHKDVTIKLCEYVKGSLGITEYPETLEGCLLWAGTADSEESGQQSEEGIRQEISYHSLGRTLKGRGKCPVGVHLPAIETEMILEPETGSFCAASVQEGILFNPYYTLKIWGELEEGKEMQVCVRLQKSR